MYFPKVKDTGVIRGTVGALSLLCGLSPLALAQNTATYINVNSALNRRVIDPRIYGVAFASTDALRDLNVVINRNGGNNTSRYNWQLNADNRGNDWYFQSIGDAVATPAFRLDTFIKSTFDAQVNAQPMITLPTIGYVANLGTSRAKLSSFSIRKYGAQTGADTQWFPDAGNGVSTTTKQFVVNNPLDANVVSDSLFQQSLVSRFVTTYGNAATTGVKYYILDNEPSLWHVTHRDVRPVGATMAEIRDKIIDYGTKVRAKDPGALIVGPEEWGWSGYFFSGFDQQYGNKNGWSALPDRTANGGWDYLPWLLSQLRANQTATGKKSLDIFSVHYYPQGGEFGSDVSTTMQLRRNRSTRSLWDPNYVDETWIGTQVRLIPRLRGWISQYYPGLKTAITEYSWGATNHINGATAQADVLGIFGREGLDLAARWTSPDPTTPTYKAIKMYRNYDGNKSTFGDTSVSAAVANPDNLSSFASVRSSDNTLTIMAINKALTGSTNLTLNTTSFPSQTNAQVYQLTSANAIRRMADIPVYINASNNTGVAYATLPPQSITLFVIPARPAFRSSATASPSTLPINTATTITTPIAATGSAVSNCTIRMEVYDATYQPIARQTLIGQNFSINQSRSFTWRWTPTKAGKYTVKVGVYNSTFSQTYHFNNSATIITAQ